MTNTPIYNRLALIGFGTFAVLNVNVEAYPDPAPAIIEVVAQYPGYSAEEVERQVTIPLEIGLAGTGGAAGHPADIADTASSARRWARPILNAPRSSGAPCRRAGMASSS